VGFETPAEFNYMSKPSREACVEGLESRRSSPVSSSRGGQVCCRLMPSGCQGLIAGCHRLHFAGQSSIHEQPPRRDIEADVRIGTAGPSEEITRGDTSCARTCVHDKAPGESVQALKGDQAALSMARRDGRLGPARFDCGRAWDVTPEAELRATATVPI